MTKKMIEYDFGSQGIDRLYKKVSTINTQTLWIRIMGISYCKTI